MSGIFDPNIFDPSLFEDAMSLITSDFNGYYDQAVFEGAYSLQVSTGEYSLPVFEVTLNNLGSSS